MAVLWSFRVAQEIPLRLIEVFALTEAVSAPSRGEAREPRRPVRGEARRATPAATRPDVRVPAVVTPPPPAPSDATPSAGPADAAPVAAAPAVALAPVAEGSSVAPGSVHGNGRSGTGGSSSGSDSATLPAGGYQVRPAYPDAARRMGIEGTALLKIRILEDGAVGEVHITRSAGHSSLDEAAVEAVRRWRFEPARRDGRPIQVWASLPIRFRLE
jgi:protein TonB